jgi:hypothetical protein
VRLKPYAAWMIFCLMVGVVLGVSAYLEAAANFAIEPGLGEEMLARAEHNRAESATVAALGNFFLPLPFVLVGVIVIWTARRWR